MTQLFRALGDLPATSSAVLDVGHLLVALADRDLSATRRGQVEHAMAQIGTSTPDDLWAELRGTARTGDAGWPGWRYPTLALLAVDHPWYAGEKLSAGSLHRRIDAVLDVFDSELCAHEVQTVYWEIVEKLAHAADGDEVQGLALVGSPGRHSGQPLTHELAKVVLMWLGLGESGAGRDAQRALVRRCQSKYRTLDAGDADPVALRTWRAALEEMDGLQHEGHNVPDLVGLALDEAGTVARRLGLTLHHRDVAQASAGSPASSRIPLVESGWRVVAQYPLAGAEVAHSDVVLGIVKASEHADRDPGRLVHERFEELVVVA